MCVDFKVDNVYTPYTISAGSILFYNDLGSYIILRTKFYNYNIGGNIAKTFNVQIDEVEGYVPLLNLVRYTSSDNVIPMDNYNTGEDSYMITLKFRNIGLLALQWSMQTLH